MYTDQIKTKMMICEVNKNIQEFSDKKNEFIYRRRRNSASSSSSTERTLPCVWLGGVAVKRRIRDREVASSIPGCSAATCRCNSGQVVHTRVPLFTKQYKLAPASAGGKVHHRSGVGYAGSHSADLIRLAANRRHSSIVLTCGRRCTAASK